MILNRVCTALFFFSLVFGSSEPIQANSCHSLFLDKKELFFPNKMIRSQDLEFYFSKSDYPILVETVGSFFNKTQKRPSILDEISVFLEDPIAIEVDPSQSFSFKSVFHKKEVRSKERNYELVDQIIKSDLNIEIDSSSLTRVREIFEKLQHSELRESFSIREQVLLSVLLKEQTYVPILNSEPVIPLDLVPSIKDLVLYAINPKSMPAKEVQTEYWERLRKFNRGRMKTIATKISKNLSDWSKSAELLSKKFGVDYGGSSRNDKGQRAYLPGKVVQKRVKLPDELVHTQVFFQLLTFLRKVQKERNLMNKRHPISRSEFLKLAEEVQLKNIARFGVIHPFRSEEFLDVLDFVFFARAIPKDHSVIQTNLLDEAGKLLIKARAQKSEVRSKETKQSRGEKHRPRQHNFVILKEASKPSQEPTGRKRRHKTRRQSRQNSTGEAKRNTKVESSELVDSKIDLKYWTNYVERSEVRALKELEAGKVYETLFLGSVVEGVQTIQFSEKVLEFFRKRPKVGTQFVKAFVKGKTGRGSSQAGIKETSRKSINGNDYFELRPGKSSIKGEGAWRAILEFDKSTQMWILKEMKSKSEMLSFLNGN